jgi:hypothetical protein
VDDNKVGRASWNNAKFGEAVINSQFPPETILTHFSVRGSAFLVMSRSTFSAKRALVVEVFHCQDFDQ